MKRISIVFVFLLSAAAANACDLCGLYSSIIPKYSDNYIGLRMRARSFEGRGMHDHSMEHQENTEHEHPGHYHDNYYSLDLTGRYFITKKLSASIVLPYSASFLEREGKQESFSGIGDPSLLIHYRIVEKSKGNWRHIANIGAGLKAPLGNYKRKLDNGEYDIHAQTGSGSTDYLFNLSYLGRLRKTGISADAVYRLNGTNPDGYRFGNRYNCNVNMLYWINKGTDWLFLPQGGLYGEFAPVDRQNGHEVHGSGGKALFANAGLDVFFKNLSFSNNIQVPLAQEPGAGMPLNSFRFISALTWYL